MSFPQRLGRFQLLSELGRGAHAIVYRARDTILKQDIALKVLYPHFLNTPKAVDRFRREGEIMASLEHPHIIPVLKTGMEKGRLYIAMPLLGGETLATFISRHGRVSFSEMLRLMREVSAALDFIHGHGVIHRDLKPSNILLDATSKAYLGDFGIVQVLTDQTLTSTMGNDILGTAPYLAPELWEGKKPSIESDVYAMACIVYEMLTGELLFVGTTQPQVMRAHDSGPRFRNTWPEGVPRRIDEVLRKALARETNTRFTKNPAESPVRLRRG